MKPSVLSCRLALVVVISLVLVCASGCRSAGHPALDEARLRVGGDPARGATLIQRYGCGGCHRIPGVDGAAGRSAPSLEHLPQEAYITGNLPNTPENVMRWIRSPRSVLPQTRMPELGIGAAEARDITTYLWSVR